jgi:hypothetical protein
VLKEFCVWLVARINALNPPPDLVLGGNVQVGYREHDAPVRCHVLIETGGPADFDLPYRQDVMIQIVTRGADYQLTRADAWAIYTAIEGTSGWTIGPLVSAGQAYKVWSIGALAKPQSIGQDAKGAHEFSTNFLIAASPI